DDFKEAYDLAAQALEKLEAAAVKIESRSRGTNP
ncbi:hypothetical protein LCGC14_2560650, partial [marine sediment metagenome]